MSNANDKVYLTLEIQSAGFTVGSEHMKVLQMSIFARASFDKT